MDYDNDRLYHNSLTSRTNFVPIYDHVDDQTRYKILKYGTYYQKIFSLVVYGSMPVYHIMFKQINFKLIFILFFCNTNISL